MPMPWANRQRGELCSPLPRVTSLADQYGIRSPCAVYLAVIDDDGVRWEFNNDKRRHKTRNGHCDVT